ncbi:MAG: energy-coupled thiamine transporter ThiT [Clostridiales bacterium]|nr:energy-coupled thiamine transporter ThiT [Clostridiales bacterium]
MKELWEILKRFASGDESIDKSTFKTIRTLLGSFALYATIAVAVAIIVYAIIIRNRDEDHLAKSRKTIVGVIIGYSVGVISILGFLEVAYQIWSGDINKYYWMFIGLIALMIVGIVVTLILKKKQIKAYKWVALAFAVAFVVYAIALAFSVPAIDDDYAPLDGQNWQMTVVTVVLVAVIVALSVLGGKKDDGYDAKALTYGAICVALAYALSYIKFFSLPQGGSVTFASMLPIILYSYMFGTRRGLVVGVVYGMLQFIQSPQFYQPMQALLDYPIAFGALGVAGIARKIPFIKGKMLAEFAVGATVAILLRYFAHVVSGYYVFSSWAMEGYTAVSWAFVYNMFVFADLAIVLVIGILALSTKTLRRTIVEAQQ